MRLVERFRRLLEGPSDPIREHGTRERIARANRAVTVARAEIDRRRRLLDADARRTDAALRRR